MKLWLRLTFAAAGLIGIWIGIATAQGRGTTPPAPTTGKKAGEYFKNVTTTTLKDLSVDDFLASMGVMSAALGYDCADCHPGAGTDSVDFVTDSNPDKKTARRMLEMLTSINKTYFAGAQFVTCWTCHHQQENPATSIALDRLYSPPTVEDSDIVRPGPGKLTATAILDKYIQAIGGAQRLAGLTSFIATGKSIGYESLGGEGDITIYGKAPNQRSTVMTFKETNRPPSIWTFNGTTGWIKIPRGFLDEIELVGEELDGQRFEAQLAFPGQIKTILTNWRTGADRVIDDKNYFVVQGSGPRGYLVTLYFDQETGLLRRMVRYGPSPVGRVSVQMDYTDYRDVGGIKFPFEYQFLWLDGRFTAKLNEIKTNVPIDAAVFARP
jgi:photosynthetic reaction center cytochrome c subunit